VSEGAHAALERARRIERAHAVQLERTREARAVGAPALAVGGGLAVFHGVRSPFSTAVGVGLGVPVSAADVDRVEGHLGVGGGPVRIEVTPFTDPSLADELARRGYQVERFFQVWHRPPGPLPEAPPLPVRPAAPGEERTWVDLFSRAHLGAPVQAGPQEQAFLGMTRARGNLLFLGLVEGVPAGVAALSIHEGTAYLSGAGVVASARGRGLQRALVRARLERAIAESCDLAAAATEPGTASQRTMERSGFRIAYPKVVLVR
jgi:ribosomal protein S18 acetylase RimI-like enzyme